MTLKELREAFRLRVHDLRGRNLWTDAEILRYANEAVNEAAERAKLLFDDVTKQVCDIAGKVDQQAYRLHESIFEIESCTWDGRFLKQVSRSQLDETPSYTRYKRYGFEGDYHTPTDWRTLKGTPDYFIHENFRRLLLSRVPTRAAPIHLTVYRYPLEPLAADGDEPEIHWREHEKLLDWMAHLAYLKQDTETFDSQAAKRAEDDFTKSFGKKIDANVRRQQREWRTHQIQMNPEW